MTIVLSIAGRRRVDWNRICDAAAVPTARTAESDNSSDRSNMQMPTPDRVRAAFGVARDEFRTASAALRGVMTLLLVMAGVSAAVAIAGVVVGTMLNSLATGASMSVVGITGMFGFFLRVYRAGRDQALFEFLPAKYELAMSLAQSPEQFARLLDAFLLETKTQRDG